MTTRIYKVTHPNGTVQLVRASTQSEAIAKVAALQSYKAEPVNAVELVTLLSAGVELPKE